MYKSLHIKNFRLFRDFKIESLGRVNLISGRNNTGKTSLLEAIFLLNGPAQPRAHLVLAGGRGLDVFSAYSTATIWETAFRDFDIHQEIEITAETDNDMLRLIIQTTRSNGAESLQISASDLVTDVAISTREQREIIEYLYTRRSENQVYKTIVHSVVNGELEYDAADIPNLSSAVINFSRGKPTPESDAERFSQLNKLKFKEDLIKGLQVIEPKLEDIELAFEAKRLILYGDAGGKRLIPLALMGDGINRLLSMLVNTFWAADGIVLLDEVDDGFHYQTMPKVWQALDEFSLKHNVQIFATTHSAECIEAATEAFEKADPGTFRYHRLDKLDNDTIEAVTYNDEALEGAIEFNIEMR